MPLLQPKFSATFVLNLSIINRINMKHLSMKKFVNYGLSLMLIASPFLITGCGEDGENPEPDAPEANAPTLSIVDAEEADETTIEIGQEVAFKVNVTAPGIFNAFIVNKTVDGGSTEEIDRVPRDPGTSPTTYDYDFSFTAEEDDAGKEIIFDFVAVDDNDNEGMVTYTINVSEAAAIEEYETVLLGGQANTTVESFYNGVENLKYFYSAANNETTGAKVDFIFTYGSTNGNALSSPDDADSRSNWENIYELPLTHMNNATRFKMLTTTTYAEIINSNQVASAYAENQNDELSRMTQLEVGQAFAFALDANRGGRYGIAEVVDIQGDGGNNRTITLKIKIQTEDNN